MGRWTSSFNILMLLLCQQWHEDETYGQLTEFNNYYIEMDDNVDIKGGSNIAICM
jgi:hypothetical protein